MRDVDDFNAMNDLDPTQPGCYPARWGSVAGVDKGIQ